MKKEIKKKQRKTKNILCRNNRMLFGSDENVGGIKPGGYRKKMQLTINQSVDTT